MGFDDASVRGFDLDSTLSTTDATSMSGTQSEMTSGATSVADLQLLEETFDQLDIYAKFLGENEYFKMKENFSKALDVMT